MRRVAPTALLLTGLALLLAGAWRWHDNATLGPRLAAIRAGRIVPDPAAPAALSAARLHRLIAQGAFDPAETVIEQAPPDEPPSVRARLLTILGNARLRQVMAVYSTLAFRKVKPMIVATLSDYRRAATLDPTNWDARYDFALTAELLPTRELYQRASGTQMSHDRAVWPDLPGTPNGMP